MRAGPPGFLPGQPACEVGYSRGQGITEKLGRGTRSEAAPSAWGCGIAQGLWDAKRGDWGAGDLLTRAQGDDLPADHLTR